MSDGVFITLAVLTGIAFVTVAVLGVMVVLAGAGR